MLESFEISETGDDDDDITISDLVGFLESIFSDYGNITVHTGHSVSRIRAEIIDRGVGEGNILFLINGHDFELERDTCN